MIGRALLVGLGILAGFAFTAPAEASTGWTTTAVNMRTCGSARCPRILTIPARAPVHVHWCGRWCLVEFAGRTGYSHSRYISHRQYRQYRQYRRPPVIIVPPHVRVYPRHRNRPYIYPRHRDRPNIYRDPQGKFWRYR